jgi:transcriptional regulator with XRE-family HTH domain
MNNVKRKKRGRPRRDNAGVDLRMLGKRIRHLRGKTPQEVLSNDLGVTQAQLSKYELGLSAPPLGVVAKLAKRFDRTVDWILTGNG